MRIAALIRVSSSKQAGEGTSSLDVQEAGIRAACKTLGFPPPVDWYKGVESGVGTKPREQFEKMLADCVRADCQWDAVMVYEPTRWCRNVEDGARAIRTLLSTRPKKEFFVRERNMRINTAAGRQAMGFASAMASGEADALRERIMANKWKRANEGKWCVRPPWGLKFRDGKWIVLPGAKATAQRAYDMIVRRNFSLAKVAKALGNGNATQWNERIRKFAIPWFTLQHPETGEVKTFTFPDAPRLLTAQQLKAIEKKWAANGTKAGQLPDGHVYLLRHRIKCACGSTLGGVPRDRDGNVRYEYRHAKSTQKTKKCVNAVSADWLENEVFWDLRNLLQRKDLAEIIERGYSTVDHRIDFEGLLATARAELANVSKAKRTLLTNTELSKKILDKRSMHDFADMAQELSDKQTQIESRIAELEQEQAQVVYRKDHAQQVAAVLQQLSVNPQRWHVDNKLLLLDTLLGAENCKGRPPGIYVSKVVKANGRCDYPRRYVFDTDVSLALEHLAGTVEPEDLRWNRVYTTSDITNTST